MVGAKFARLRADESDEGGAEFVVATLRARKKGS
jgi:hypothetical protein